MAMKELYVEDEKQSDKDVVLDEEKDDNGKDCSFAMGLRATNLNSNDSENEEYYDCAGHENLVKDEGGYELVWKKVTMEVVSQNRKSDNDDADGKRILSNVNGSAGPGKVTCILGHSGAGKTSLLRVLAGRAKSSSSIKVEGTIGINDKHVNPAEFLSKHDLRIAFVAQEDILIPFVTPREALRFSARLRLPEHCTDSAIDDLVSSTLNGLRLDKVADQFAKDLSGGEKRRISLGVELVTQPKILLIDEVTSGLDSHNAAVVMEVCHRISRDQYMTVLMTIHQPNSEIFMMMDKVILMHHGMCMFEGLASNLSTHFALRGFETPTGFSVLDWALRVSQTVTSEDLKSHGFFTEDDDLETSISPKVPTYLEESVQSVHFQRVSRLTEIRELFRREFISLQRDMYGMLCRFTTVIATAIIMAICYCGIGEDSLESAAAFSSHVGAVYFMAFSCFVTVIIVVREASNERAIFCREYLTGHYRILSYVCTKLAFEVATISLLGFVYLTITFWALGLQGQFWFWLPCEILHGLVGSAFAYLLVAIPSNPYVATDFVPLVLAPQMLLSGFLVNAESLPSYVQWTVWLPPLTYAFRLLLNDEFQVCMEHTSVEKYDINCAKAAQTLLRNGRDALLSSRNATITFANFGTVDAMHFNNFFSTEANPRSLLWYQCRREKSQLLQLNEAGDGYCDVTVASVEQATVNKQFARRDLTGGAHWLQYVAGSRLRFTYPPDFSSIEILNLDYFLPPTLLDRVYNDLLNSSAIVDGICDASATFCSKADVSRGYISKAQCIGDMEVLPALTSNENGVQTLDGNSTGCRHLYATLATQFQKDDCPHISFTAKKDSFGQIKCHESSNYTFSDHFADRDFLLFQRTASAAGMDIDTYLGSYSPHDGTAGCSNDILTWKAIEAANVLPNNYFCESFLEVQNATGEHNAVYWMALLIYEIFLRSLSFIFLYRKAKV